MGQNRVWSSEMEQSVRGNGRRRIGREARARSRIARARGRSSRVRVASWTGQAVGLGLRLADGLLHEDWAPMDCPISFILFLF